MISHCQLMNMLSGNLQIDFEEAGSECPAPTDISQLAQGSLLQ